MALVLIALCGLIVDGVFTVDRVAQGEVVGLQYDGPSSSVGVGTGIGANGKPASGVVVTSKSEKFIVHIRTQSGDVIRAETDADVWYALSEGDSVPYVESRGCITGMVWGNHVEEFGGE